MLYSIFSHFSCVWLFATPWTVAPRLLGSWDSPGKNIGVGSHSLSFFMMSSSHFRIIERIWIIFPYALENGFHLVKRASLVAQMVKNLPAMQETWVQSLGWEDPLEKGKATHSSILAWRIPQTEEPGGLQPTGSQRIGHDWVTWKKRSSPVKPSKPSMPGPLFVGSSLTINLFTCYRSSQIFYFLSVLVVFNLSKNFPNSSAAAVAKSLQLCLTLHDPMDCSLPGSSVHGDGVLQARVLEWVGRLCLLTQFI